MLVDVQDGGDALDETHTVPASVIAMEPSEVCQFVARFTIGKLTQDHNNHKRFE